MLINNNTPPNSLIKTNKEHFNALDGLRSYAALGIVLMHILANIKIKPSANYITEHLIPFFTDFTLLFMMVSGFSLCCGYYQKIKDGTITPKQFLQETLFTNFTFLCNIMFARFCFIAKCRIFI